MYIGCFGFAVGYLVWGWLCVTLQMWNWRALPWRRQRNPWKQPARLWERSPQSAASCWTSFQKLMKCMVMWILLTKLNEFLSCCIHKEHLYHLCSFLLWHGKLLCSCRLYCRFVLFSGSIVGRGRSTWRLWWKLTKKSRGFRCLKNFRTKSLWRRCHWPTFWTHRPRSRRQDSQSFVGFKPRWRTARVRHRSVPAFYFSPIWHRSLL